MNELNADESWQNREPKKGELIATEVSCGMQANVYCCWKGVKYLYCLMAISSGWVDVNERFSPESLDACKAELSSKRMEEKMEDMLRIMLFERDKRKWQERGRHIGFMDKTNFLEEPYYSLHGVTDYEGARRFFIYLINGRLEQLCLDGNQWRVLWI